MSLVLLLKDLTSVTLNFWPIISTASFSPVLPLVSYMRGILRADFWSISSKTAFLLAVFSANSFANDLLVDADEYLSILYVEPTFSCLIAARLRDIPRYTTPLCTGNFSRVFP